MNQIIVTALNGASVYCAIIQDRLEYLEWDAQDQTDEICIGRVENIVENIHAAFVRYEKEKTGYLSLKDVVPGAVLNRSFQEKDKLRCGDEIAVQIKSAALKTKQPHLTCQLSLAGKYAVLTFGKRGIGCSLKLQNSVREKLIQFVRNGLTAESPILNEYGILLRTEAGNPDTNPADVLKDIDALYQCMAKILLHARSLTPFSVLYQKDELTAVNDHLMNLYHFCCKAGIQSDDLLILTDNIQMRDTLNQSDLKKIHPEIEIAYRDPSESDLKILYGLPAKIEDCMKKKVWLKSGGYLIIEQTEAMNVIDVNSGKNITGKQNIFAKINMEAAEECMRQIRLRNLSGMILIDFINMEHAQEYADLEIEIRRLCQLDPVMVQFIDFTGLGIAELTRVKKGKSLIDNQNNQ